MDEINPIYLAGVIDSDGSISLLKRSNQTTISGFHFRPIVQITWSKNTLTKRVFESIKKSYGGSMSTWVRKKNDFDSKNKECYKYSIEGVGLEKMLIHIVPHLRLKKNQAELALQLIKARKSWRIKNGGRVKPNSLIILEEKLYLNFNKINTKNKKYG